MTLTQRQFCFNFTVTFIFESKRLRAEVIPVQPDTTLEEEEVSCAHDIPSSTQ